jgi:hypothetical protein
VRKSHDHVRCNTAYIYDDLLIADGMYTMHMCPTFLLDTVCFTAAVTPGAVTAAAVTADEAALYSLYDDEFFTYPEPLLQLLQQNATSAAAAGSSVSASGITADRRLHNRAQTSLGFHRDTTIASDTVSTQSRAGSSGSNTG